MVCNYCGSKVRDDAAYCPNCGEKPNTTKKNLIKEQNKKSNDDDDKAKSIEILSTTGTAIGWGVLGFFIPIVGLILFLAWKNNYPENAKGAGIGALARVCLWFLFFIITFIITLLSNS